MLKVILLATFIIGDFFTGSASYISSARLARKIQQEIYAWDVEGARRDLENLPEDSPLYHYLKGYILFYEENYGEALKELEIAVKELQLDQVASLYNLVKNTYEETASFKKVETEHFVIYYRPGKDEILIPFAKETLEKAWKNVGTDLDYFPKGKIRVEIYPSYESFMRISTLTRKDIETSGTIALCNYNRIMITSPRSTLFGYRWRDTLNHEMVHYFLTRMTRNYAPLWLQEGVAKAEETRWRLEGPRPLSPIAQTVLSRALKKGDFVTFDEMIPSFAKLGSSERVTLAFAEVLSMVHMIIDRGGYPLLRKLINASVTYRGDSEKMIRVLGYDSLQQFLEAWKNYIRSQKLVTLEYIPDERVPLSRKNLSEDHFRLGEMLKDRLHFASAAYEFQKAIKNSSRYDPVLYYKYAFTLFHSGRIDEARKVLEKSIEFSPDYESMYALLGYIYLRKKEWNKAIDNFNEAIDLNPFDPLIHRGLIEAYSRLGREKDVAREKQILKILTGGGSSD